MYEVMKLVGHSLVPAEVLREMLHLLIEVNGVRYLFEPTL